MILETIVTDKIELALMSVGIRVNAKGNMTQAKYAIGWKAKGSSIYSWQYANVSTSIRIARNRMIRMYKASTITEIVAKT